jgi:hypothetical protein
MIFTNEGRSKQFMNKFSVGDLQKKSQKLTEESSLNRISKVQNSLNAYQDRKSHTRCVGGRPRILAVSGMNSIRSISSVGLDISDRTSKASCTPIKVANLDMGTSVLKQLEGIDPADGFFLRKPTVESQRSIYKILRENNTSKDLIVSTTNLLERILRQNPSRYFFL